MFSNPWLVQSIYDFNFFCCPECDTRERTKQDFVNHAAVCHPKSLVAFPRISDGSLNDVTVPEQEIKEEQLESIGEFLEIKQETVEEELSKAPKKRQKLTPKSYADSEPEDTEGFSCDICEYVGSSAALLVNHVKKNHQTGESFPCSHCSEVCSSSQGLKVHLWNVHKIGKNSEKCLCSLCGKTIVGRSNFKKHEREKHGIISASFVKRRKQVKIECEVCQVKFGNAKDLNEHVVECTKESKDFSCINCDLKWASGPVLNVHLKIDHQYQEMYTCHVCGKCLKKKASMESHIKVEHEKKKDHICHLCGTGFARAQGLRFHMQRIHERSGKYACDYCSFRTVAQLQLDIHVNAVHTKSKKFQCKECNFFCFHRQGLLAHIKTVHLKLKPHQCTKCLEAYVRRKDLEKHKEMTGHHDEETNITEISPPK